MNYVNWVDEAETGFACNMLAIEPGQREAHFENIKQLMGQVQATRELADGYALELPAEAAWLVRAVEFINLERRCCPFFGFGVELGPRASTFWLQLTGPAGVKPFIRPS